MRKLDPRQLQPSFAVRVWIRLCKNNPADADLRYLLGTLEAGKSRSVQEPISTTLAGAQYGPYLCVNCCTPAHCPFRKKVHLQVRLRILLQTVRASPRRPLYRRQWFSADGAKDLALGQAVEMHVADNVPITLKLVFGFLNTGARTQWIFVVVPSDVPTSCRGCGHQLWLPPG